MRGSTVAELGAYFSVLVYVLVTAIFWAGAGCSSDHRVSPWGAGGLPPITAFAAPPDIEAHLRAIDAETSALGLERTSELVATLPRGGGPVVVRGYEGVDALGRVTHAVRAATAQGVVMAVGPRDASEHATELVVEVGVLRSLSDLNGDGRLDVVLRGKGSVLEVHSVLPTGSVQCEVQMPLPPVDVADVDSDGRIDLVGRVPVPDGDPIAPSFIEVAMFDAGLYRSSADVVIAFHERRANELSRIPKGPAETDAARLRRALERAWHALHAGHAHDTVLETLRKETVPPSLRDSFDRHISHLPDKPTKPTKPATPPPSEPATNHRGSPERSGAQ